MKRFERNLLVLILLASVLLSILSLTRGQVWGDDWAGYVLQAQSLAQGSPRDFIQHNTFTIQNSTFPPGPAAYPWGYPAMLAPFVGLFGLKLLPLKLLNTLFYLFFLYALFLLGRMRLPAGWALALTAVFAFNPVLLLAHDQILSDIPFLFASTLAVLLIESRTWASARGALLTGLAIFFASMLRANGVLLLVPLLLAQILDLRARAAPHRWLTLALPWLAFAALLLAQSLLLPSGQDSYLSHFSMFSGTVLLRNLRYYLLLPADFVEGIPLGLIFLLLLAALLLYDLFAAARRNLVILSYLAASLGLFLLWPENQGLRFLYPLLPLLLLLAAQGLRLLLDRLPMPTRGWAGYTAFFLCMAFLLLSLGVSVNADMTNLRTDRQINGPFDPVSREMFDFLKGKTPPDSVIVFFKPRAMRLLSGRDSFMTLRCEDLARADYFVLHEKQGSNAQIADLALCPGLDYPVVFNNQRFTVYELR